MWRHAKKHVIDDIRLPPLHLQAVFLRFTAVELEYYRKYLSDLQSEIINAVMSANPVAGARHGGDARGAQQYQPGLGMPAHQSRSRRRGGFGNDADEEEEEGDDNAGHPAHKSLAALAATRRALALPDVSTRLEGLRMVCDHPQISVQSFLGARVLTMPEIAMKLKQRARDECTEHERKLARDWNALGVFYLSFPSLYPTSMAIKVRVPAQ